MRSSTGSSQPGGAVTARFRHTIQTEVASAAEFIPQLRFGISV